MEVLLEKAIEACFEEDSVDLKAIVRDIFGNSNNYSDTIKSLKMLSLEVIILEKMYDDVTFEVLFSLIYAEPLNLQEFSDRQPTRRLKPRQKRERKKEDARTSYAKRHRTFVKLRQDPDVMFAVFEQNLGYSNTMSIIITRTELIIQLTSFTIAKFQNPEENEEFDRELAQKFFQLCLKKHCQMVTLQMEGEAIHTYNSMKNHLKPIIDSVKQTRSPDGWKQEFDKNRTVYWKNDDSIVDNTMFVSRFSVAKEHKNFQRNLYFASFE